jgi:hypothetical protein
VTGRTSQRKGSGGELEVIELVRAAGWDRATRNFASGAAGNGDIAHGPADVVLEIKRTERLRLRESWRQAEAAAWAAGPGVLPVLATRWNGGRSGTPPWLAITELDELLALLRLRETA